MALLWLAPAWLVVDDARTAAVVVLVGTPLGMLPDLDLYLRLVVPTVKHHGVFHTLLAVAAFAVVLGPLLGSALRAVEDAVERVELPADARSNATELAAATVLVAGSAHVFADVLSAPDIADAIEPFWPVYPHRPGIDVLYYDDPFWNAAFLVAGVAVNVALWQRTRSA